MQYELETGGETVNKQGNVIVIDDRRKYNKKSLFVCTTGEIYEMLLQNVHESNIDYAIGRILEDAEDIALLCKEPGIGKEHMKAISPERGEEIKGRARAIKEMVRTAQEKIIKYQ